MTRARFFNLLPEAAIAEAWLQSQRVDRETPQLDGIDRDGCFWLGFETAIQWIKEYQEPDPMEVEIIEFPLPVREHHVEGSDD